MIICGIKLTHDGAIALIDNGKLVFSYEREKIDGAPRYSEFRNDLFMLKEILEKNGYSFDSIDQIVIDGWGDELNPLLEEGKKVFIKANFGRGKIELEVAKYGHFVSREDILGRSTFHRKRYGIGYSSYMHVAGHIFSSYCTSPFAKKNENSFILAWDGGMTPQLFYYNCSTGKIENLGTLFLIYGRIYGQYALNFEPFTHLDKTDLSTSGKVMAYIALGRVREKLLHNFKQIFNDQQREIKDYQREPALVTISTQDLINRFVNYSNEQGYEPADSMATLHLFLQELLLEKLKEKMENYRHYTGNLCLTGGCGLNIKWNSAIRESGMFKDIWVPPFPNDSGSAIGAACCEMVTVQGITCLEWDVYTGPPLKNEAGEIDGLWGVRNCSIKELAKLLHETSEPVIFLNGNAELGPRALGNRSIFAPAQNPAMKDMLNKIKKRAEYRPVAPICLEEDAAEIFDPGIKDPYMLFDHKLRIEWRDKVPAISHLDNTARLQTINKNQNREVYDLLTEYKKLSGIPLLCNTSANCKGKGFFPDIQSAAEWGGANYIWSNQKLYSKRRDLVTP